LSTTRASAVAEPISGPPTTFSFSVVTITATNSIGTTTQTLLFLIF